MRANDPEDLRLWLEAQQTPVTYAEAARAFALTPPGTIAQITDALEQLMAQDAAQRHPFIAARVVGRLHGLPGPGFFALAQTFGRYDGPPDGPRAAAFHRAELASLGKPGP